MYGKEVDVWALGCFAYELAVGNVPFGGQGEAGLIEAIMDKNKPAPSIGNQWSEQYRDFVAQCLQKDRDQRIKVDQMLQHPFL